MSRDGKFAGPHPVAPARAALWTALPMAVVLTGCSGEGGQQSILNPQGARAEPVIDLWQTMLIIGVVVWVLVVVLMVIALVRKGRDSGEGRRTTWAVAVAGAAVPAIVLTAVTAQSAVVLREINPDASDEEILVAVTGHQYWWEVRYPGADVVTANEIHIPVDERVQLQVTTNDVIHSFWVPELSGKTDMIPGRSNEIWLEADEPGVYWGQCAEFCGLQHAKMRFVVVAHDPEEFAGWIAAQQQPAEIKPAQDEGELVSRGREVFMSSSCVYCHTVAGTAAKGQVGPDLTHLDSRETLAAGILPNTTGNLAAWVVDPQSIKPGNLMPGTDLSGEDLQALLAYLESLD